MELPSWAQDTKGQVQAASQTSNSVSAELVKGKLSPSSSKPGDKVALRLNNDVRSNGAVLLKKGTTITGVVKNVKQVDSKSKTGAQSMMEIEWLAPTASGAATQNLNIALQSLAYTNPLFVQQQNEESGFAGAGLAAPRTAPQSSGGSSSHSGGLLGGATGSTSSTVSTVSSVGATSSGAIGGVQGAGTGAAGSVTSGAGSTVNAAGRASTGAAGSVASGAGSTVSAAGRAGTGLAVSPSIPSAPVADAGVVSSLHDNFGVSGGTLYSMGHGQVITAEGTRNNVDLFSHLSNDTVITSPGRNFEVSSGAQMQLLVGVSGH
jgi:hypothetical protein